MKKILLLLIFALCACAETEDDRIGSAQLCLDKATPDTAMACVEPIKDSTKASAQIVKCSAGFTAEHFYRGERLIKAYRQLQDPAQGTPSFLGVMTFSSLRTSLENRNFARQIYGYCQGTEQPAYRLLGAVSFSATTISAVGGLHWSRDNPPTKADIQRAIMALKATRNDPETIQALTDVGNAALVMFINGCNRGTISNQKICDQVEAAISGGGDKSGESLGERLLDRWDQ